MRPNIVLIDYESVQPAALELLASDHFRVLVFVGATQNKLPFDLVAAAQRLGPRAEYIKIAGVGRNALDFHIAYYVGKLAAADPTAFFHIISKDGGFDPLIQHLKEQNIFSRRWPDIEDIPLVKAARQRTPDDRAATFLASLPQAPEKHPRSEKSLRSAIAVHFYKQLSEEEVSAVVATLRTLGAFSFLKAKVTHGAAG